MQTIRRPQITVPWSGAQVSRLCLGTAQLGMSYGIANRTGQPRQEEADRMIECAWESGADLFDTAQAYGTSEECLGKAIQSLGIGSELKIISKIHPSLEHASADEVVKAVQKTLTNLGIGKLFSLMLHREEWLRGWPRFKNIAELIFRNDLTESLGVSIYTMEGFEAALAIDEIKTIQMPFNLFDQRLRLNKCSERASKSGKLLFVRSIYLQGLLTMTEINIPNHLDFARPFLSKLLETLKSLKVSASEAAFRFALQHAPEAVLVVGAETFDQVQENIRFFNTVKPFSEKENELLFDLAKDIPAKLIDPSQWAAA